MKMKGAVAPIESSSFADVYVDPRNRFNKHQSLAQDYKELQKETEAMKKKLQVMKQKKLTLIAEVRFLRRRYKYLIQNQSSKTPQARNFVQPLNSDVRNKLIIKEMKYNGKEVGLPPPVPRFDLNQKGKIHLEKDATHVRAPAPIFDLNQKHRIYSHGNEALRNAIMIPDLNLGERVYNNGKETTMRSMTPVFDLNKISREEEELAAYGETMMGEDLKNNSIRSGNEELLSDMKLSICRNIGRKTSTKPQYPSATPAVGCSGFPPPPPTTMTDRDRYRDRDRERERDRDRERERRRDKDERDRDREQDRDRERDRDRDRERTRSKRSRTPDHHRSRHTRSRTRSPDRYRSRSRSTDRDRDRSYRNHRHRTPSPEPPRKRHRHGSAEDEKDKDRKKAVSDFVDEIAKEQQHKKENNASNGNGVGGEEEVVDVDEIEMMKKMGIPVGFDSTKGKPVPGADVSGVRAVTKRLPRQYMNRRGGFNRPLPAERNR